MFSDCYETEEDEDIIIENSNENYWPKQVQKFRDLTGIVFDNTAKETFEVRSWLVVRRLRLSYLCCCAAVQCSSEDTGDD